MTESSVLHSPGFEMRLSIWEACHTSWVKSKVTGCSKDWASDANCLSTLKRLELPELKVYRMFEKSAQQKSSHRLTTVIVRAIYKLGQVITACSHQATEPFKYFKCTKMHVMETVAYWECLFMKWDKRGRLFLIRFDVRMSKQPVGWCEDIYLFLPESWK